MTISYSLDRKLILLVMIVSVIAISITAYTSFNYADEILKERQGDQLLGESTVRGDTLRLLLDSRIEQNKILTNDPMIRILVNELNQTSDDDFDKVKEEKRRSFLTQIQAYPYCHLWAKWFHFAARNIEYCRSTLEDAQSAHPSRRVFATKEFVLE